MKDEYKVKAHPINPTTNVAINRPSDHTPGRSMPPLHSILHDHANCKSNPACITYDTGTMLMINNQQVHHPTRTLHKSLMSLSLWGQHHGCKKDLCVQKKPIINPMLIGIHITTQSWNARDNCKATAPKPGNFAPIKFTPHPQPPQFQHLSCTLLNIHSLGDSTKADTIQVLTTSSKLDVLALTETWLSNDPLSTQKIAENSPPGFCFHHHPRLGHRSGGVGALVWKPLKVKLNHNKEYPSFEHLDFTVSTGKNTLPHHFSLPSPSIIKKQTHPQGQS